MRYWITGALRYRETSELLTMKKRLNRLYGLIFIGQNFFVSFFAADTMIAD